MTSLFYRHNCSSLPKYSDRDNVTCKTKIILQTCVVQLYFWDLRSNSSVDYNELNVMVKELYKLLEFIRNNIRSHLQSSALRLMR